MNAEKWVAFQLECSSQAPQGGVYAAAAAAPICRPHHHSV
jgi:hypothetical protein